MRRVRSQLAAKLLLAIVGAPALVVALLGLAELGCALLGSDRRPRWFRLETGAGGEALVAAAANSRMPGTHFRVERFAARPPAGTRRVVCVGDSTCYGHPFDPPVPFADWIGARLEELLPDVPTEVLNLGSSGFSSEDVLDLLDDTACAGADVLVVYVGHNEFLDRNLLAIRNPVAHAVRRAVAASRFASALAPDAGSKVDLDDAASLADVEPVRDAPLFTAAQLERGRRRYRDHLARLVALARAHGTTALLVHPVADARDTPVESSSFAAGTPPADRTRFREELKAFDVRRRALEQAKTAGRAVDAAALGDASAALDRLAALDPGVALLHYERGRMLRLQGRLDDARRELATALEQDGSPIRATTAFHAVIDAVASEGGALVVDPRPAFEAAAAPELPGQDDWFVDYCHPSLKGHELLADAILRVLARAGVFAPAERWRFGAEPSSEEYLRRGGYRPEDVAASWSRHALFVLGKAHFGGAGRRFVDGARHELENALAVDPKCALALLGLGVVATIDRDASEAIARFDQAAALSPAVLSQIAVPYRENAAVKALFEAAGLAVVDGRVVRAR